MFVKPWQDARSTGKDKVDLALDILEPATWVGKAYHVDHFKLSTVMHSKG